MPATPHSSRPLTRSHAPGAVLGHSMGGKVALALLDLASAHTHSQHNQHQHRRPGTTTSSSSSGITPASTAPSPGGAAHLHTQPHTGAGLLPGAHVPQPLCCPPRQLWVLDSQPGLVAPQMDVGTGVSRVLETVHVSRKSPPPPQPQVVRVCRLVALGNIDRNATACTRVAGLIHVQLTG